MTGDGDDYFIDLDSDASDAVEVVREALEWYIGEDPPGPELVRAANALRVTLDVARWPSPEIRAAAGWDGTLPVDDEDLIVIAAAAPVLLDADNDVHPLSYGDWIGAVVQMVRIGVGAVATPAQLVDMIGACAWVDGEVSLELRPVVTAAFQNASAIWKHCGAIDAGDRVTALGCWTLPRALCWAWGGSFD